MTLLAGDGPVLVVAPHPDDEVLGAGGTIARLAAMGRQVHAAIVTRGREEIFGAAQIETVRREAEAAHAHLGVARTHWLGFPAAELAEQPHGALNGALSALVQELAPSLVLAPHPGDIHLDHQLSFLSSLVACRPHQPAYPAMVAAYETLSETNWNAPYLTPPFVPNLFVDISGDALARKLEAFRLFESQCRRAPHERAPESLRALATLRGATIHRPAAEGFVLVRLVV
ncbi:PIG-L family deacetylase (plasmid) [Leisingera sp. S132]|uniref:PIG-L deacetylase family protein n=1 Tax=Leisingera sp. S132 TaxID=2867016 RepID=UPI0017E48DD1|nr:PIG-L deacetylase family protein [Leisingera sp. S132]NVK12650.1 PIG-L family deacetylase [Paracoccaceae bacterium]UWQ81867.1 PIG-L family deacetylase [Leisingera sp. S132]